MYSTLLDDEEYDPLLMVYLTTTGAILQNHTKSELISYALKQVVYREIGNEPVPFDVMTEVRGSLETKRQKEADFQAEQEKKNADLAALAAVPKASGAPSTP